MLARRYTGQRVKGDLPQFIAAQFAEYCENRVIGSFFRKQNQKGKQKQCLTKQNPLVSLLLSFLLLLANLLLGQSQLPIENRRLYLCFLVKICPFPPSLEEALEGRPCLELVPLVALVGQASHRVGEAGVGTRILGIKT